MINPKVRVQTYPSASTIIPKPHLNMKLNTTENLRFKMSGDYYSQNFTSSSSDKDIITLFYRFLSTPTNMQSSFTKPNEAETEPKNRIQTSWHGIFDVEYDFTRSFSMNVERYYKYFPKLSNIN